MWPAGPLVDSNYTSILVRQTLFPNHFSTTSQVIKLVPAKKEVTTFSIHVSFANLPRIWSAVFKPSGFILRPYFADFGNKNSKSTTHAFVLASKIAQSLLYEFLSSRIENTEKLVKCPGLYAFLFKATRDGFDVPSRRRRKAHYVVQETALVAIHAPRNYVHLCMCACPKIQENVCMLACRKKQTPRPSSCISSKYQNSHTSRSFFPGSGIARETRYKTSRRLNLLFLTRNCKESKWVETSCMLSPGPSVEKSIKCLYVFPFHALVFKSSLSATKKQKSRRGISEAVLKSGDGCSVTCVGLSSALNTLEASGPCSNSSQRLDSFSQCLPLSL